MRHGRAILAALAFALSATAPAIAIEPEQREVVVVHGRVWEGYEYREMFLPSTMDELTVIAGQPSAITYVRTLEYYWPLSRQVYVDFQRQRDLVEGELVVRRDGTEVSRQSLGEYSIVYPEGAVNGNGQLLWGDEAEQGYAEYRQQEADFGRRFVEAQRAHTAYQRQLLEAGAARQPGEPAMEIPPPPPLPKPSLRLVTPPQPGYMLNLEGGDYTMVLERDGAAVPGTERRVRAVSISDAATLVADVIPEERWTRPLASNTGSARIYARPGATFYMTLSDASRFEESDYLPIISPQVEPVEGRPVWVRRRPAALDTLNVAWGDETGAVSREPYKVDQTRGSGFGYTVRAARDAETPDLDAFGIFVPTNPAERRGTITGEDAGEPLVYREIVIVQPRNDAVGLALAFVPLAASMIVFAWRRRSEVRRGST